MVTEQVERSRIDEATQEADRVRREHNGVGGVFLYLGHDGDNACEFRDFDGKSLAKANSGRSLLEAIQRCEAEWRRGQWVGKLRSLMEGAAARFGSDRGIFNTACLQGEIHVKYHVEVTGREIVETLAPRIDVVRLSGGSHWLLLPDRIYRYDYPDHVLTETE